MKSSPEHLIACLAEKLTSKQIESHSIDEALHLLCDAFSFDAGFVYEINETDELELKERCIKQPVPFHERFAVNEIEPAYRAHVAESPLLLIREGLHNTPCDAALLQFFQTSSLVLFSVVDEKARIYGLIVFTNAEKGPDFTQDELRTLYLLLTMFGRYTGIRAYQIKLAFSLSSLGNILDNAGIDIYINDFNTHDILYVNKSMAAPYGGPSRFMGNKCWEVLFPGQNGPCDFCPQERLIDDEGNPTKVYSWDYQRPFDGSWFRVFSAAFRWVDGRLAHVVCSADITENKRNEELIQYMASYDALTGLPNRRKLLVDCDQRINRALQRNRGYLLFFDIDGFKAINDTFGHDAGDEFLIQLGEFFSGIPMLKDAMYRNGGDEFVAVIGDASRANIQNLANFIHARFKNPWRLKKGDIFCNTSIGVACFPDDGDSADELLLKADQAMYAIKKTGGAGVAFVGDEATDA